MTPEAPTLLAAAPVLPSRDIARTVAFYCTQVGFSQVHVAVGQYGIVERGAVALHSRSTEDA